jgi:hypothetical protein
MESYETPKLEKLLARSSQIQKVFLHNSSKQKVHIHYGPEEKWNSFPFGAMGYILRSRWEQPAHQQEPEA